MRLHFFQCQCDPAQIRFEIWLTFRIFLCVQIFKLLIRIHHIPRVQRHIDGRRSGHSVPDRDLTVGCVASSPIPFVTHQAGIPEDTINLFLNIPAPESKHGNQRHVSVGLGIIAFLPVTFVEGLELLPGFRLHGMVQHLFICQVGNRFDCVSLQRNSTLHEGFQHTGKRF